MGSDPAIESAGAAERASLPPCFLDRERGVFLVPSASTPGRTYELRAMGIGGLLVVSCDPCPTSNRESVAGVMQCRHRRAVAAELADLGLVVSRHRRWRLTEAGKAAPEFTRTCPNRADGRPSHDDERVVDSETGVVSYVCRRCGFRDVAYDPTS